MARHGSLRSMSMMSWVAGLAGRVIMIFLRDVSNCNHPVRPPAKRTILKHLHRQNTGMPYCMASIQQAICQVNEGGGLIGRPELPARREQQGGGKRRGRFRAGMLRLIPL